MEVFHAAAPCWVFTYARSPSRAYITAASWPSRTSLIPATFCSGSRTVSPVAWSYTTNAGGSPGSTQPTRAPSATSRGTFALTVPTSVTSAPLAAQTLPSASLNTIPTSVCT